ncbi:hypothetical protein HRbin02_01751 [Candidatus Calditenuaceae archaeon HR02]|nr:hypothetical protein HRbin02_01751 [Candidatus Calditenuaceae archaeon HR02]
MNRKLETVDECYEEELYFYEFDYRYAKYIRILRLKLFEVVRKKYELLRRRA